PNLENVVIPYSKILKAFKNKAERVGNFDIGIDVAMDGPDESVIYIKQGSKMLERWTKTKCEGSDIADAAIEMLTRHRRDHTIPAHIKIDITGVGYTVHNVLKNERNLTNTQLYKVNFHGKAKNQHRFADTITEMMYEAKDDLETLELLQDDDKMLSQLSRRQTGLEKNSKKRLKVVPKEEYKAKDVNKESPDRPDAFVLCLYAPKNYGVELKPFVMTEAPMQFFK
ncbi:MAG: hypothetical protein GY757_07770, partial [bacterium]|nr:hypothetical protein [bacterium]